MNKPSKLRLLLFEDCNRNCKGCCNKDWDLMSLPVCKDYSEYDIIMLTGGEPMLNPQLIKDVIHKIRETSDAKIIVYTAKVDDCAVSLEILELVDGMTITLHEQTDVDKWIDFDRHIYFNNGSLFSSKSLRLNIFSNVVFRKEDHTPYDDWLVKQNIEWIKDCPLPNDEIFMRI